MRRAADAGSRYARVGSADGRADAHYGAHCHGGTRGAYSHGGTRDGHSDAPYSSADAYPNRIANANA